MPNVAIELNANLQTQTVHACEIADNAQDNTSKSEVTIEKKVREYFSDIPILAEVARCESHFTHINPITGNVMRGRVNPNDVGVMQINEHYHSATAQKMGLDLENFNDNLTYARYLYKHYGTQPWSASSACWQKHIAMR